MRGGVAAAPTAGGTRYCVRAQVRSMCTLVDFTRAVACMPTSRPSSSTASRVRSGTRRCGPAWTVTWAAMSVGRRPARVRPAPRGVGADARQTCDLADDVGLHVRHRRRTWLLSATNAWEYPWRIRDALEEETNAAAPRRAEREAFCGELLASAMVRLVFISERGEAGPAREPLGVPRAGRSSSPPRPCRSLPRPGRRGAARSGDQRCDGEIDPGGGPVDTEVRRHARIPLRDGLYGHALPPSGPGRSPSTAARAH